jgi:hypothetical protein
MAAKTNPLGVGLDIGTMNLVAARRDADGSVKAARVRDAFLDLPSDKKKMLRLGDVNYIEQDDEIIIVGDAALETANLLGVDVRRPLQDGLISAGEQDAKAILALLIKHVLGDPQEENEVCYFSVPAAPVDRPEQDVIYHQGVFNQILDDEAMAIIFAETADDGFSGLAISFGSGMCNIALAVKTIEGLAFSVARGGDWIDAGAAKQFDKMTAARMCAIKEKGINLLDPQNDQEEALVFYYKHLIEYCLKHIRQEFKKLGGQFSLPGPIPIVISGGTSKAEGFVEFFTEVFEKKKKRFPFDISEIRHAQDPLNAVAYGLLLQANQEYEE